MTISQELCASTIFHLANWLRTIHGTHDGSIQNHVITMVVLGVEAHNHICTPRRKREGRFLFANTSSICGRLQKTPPKQLPSFGKCSQNWAQGRQPDRHGWFKWPRGLRQYATPRLRPSSGRLWFRGGARSSSATSRET